MNNTPDDLYKSAKSGQCSMVLISHEDKLKGVFFVRIDKSEGKRILFIPAMGGEDFMSWYPDLDSYLDNMAMDNACSIIEVNYGKIAA